MQSNYSLFWPVYNGKPFTKDLAITLIQLLLATWGKMYVLEKEARLKENN